MPVKGKDQQNRPVVLMVGRGEPTELALRVALDRRGLQIKSASIAEVAQAAVSVAPDLMLLVGDASGDGAAPILRDLAANPTTSVVPVALLSDDGSLDPGAGAFRSGAVAGVPRGASTDAVADQVLQILEELPQRSGTAAGDLGEATLDELVAWVNEEHRTGILTVEPARGGSDQAPMRVVLGAGQPVAEALEAFVERLQPLIARAEPLRYEFREEPTSRLKLLDELRDEEEPPGDPSLFEGLHILLMDTEPERAEALAGALRDRRALVGVTGASEEELDRAGNQDPEVVILDARAVEGPGFEAVRRMRRDVRMRWASLLVVKWDELWPDRRLAPPIARLAAHVEPLIANDRRLSQRAAKELRFDTRLELTGPGRFLRALVRAGPTLHIVVRSPKLTAEVDLSEGILVGAQGTLQGGDGGTVEGTRALAGLLALGAARVHVERRGHPAVMNLMTPVDEALDAAAQESSPVPISFRPPAAPLKAVPDDGEEADPDDARTDPPRMGLPGSAKSPPAGDRARTSGNGAAKRTLQGPGARAAGLGASSRGAGDNGSDWENEVTQPPTDRNVLESARQMAVRSDPPPAEGAAASERASAGGGGGASTASGPSQPARRKKTLVGMAPPGSSGGGSTGGPGGRQGKPASPPPPPVAGTKKTLRGPGEPAKPGAPARPAAGAPPKAAGAPPKAAGAPPKAAGAPPKGRGGEAAPRNPAHPGGASASTGDRERKESTEELELADLLEPEEEAPQDPALAQTMLPSQEAAPPPPPPTGRGSPAPPPPPPPKKAAQPPPKEAAHPPPKKAAQPPPKPATGATAPAPPAEPEITPDPEATEILARQAGKGGSSRRLLLLGAAAALAAAVGVAAVWLVREQGLVDGGEPVARSEAAPGSEGEPAGAGAPSGTEEGAGGGEPGDAPETGAEDADEGQAAEGAGADEGQADEGPAEGEDQASAEEPEEAEEPASEADGDEEDEAAPVDEVPVEQVANPELESDRLVLEARRMIRQGELAGAEARLDRALELDSRNVRAFAGYAALHLARNNAAKALENARKAVKWRRKRAPYHILLGDAHRMNGNDAKARRSYHRALQLEPGNREARKRLR